MDQRIPAEVFSPGEFVKDELEARGWTQADLAEILGRPARLVSEIIAGKKHLTPETAHGLGAAFAMDPQVWMNLESAYRLSRARAPGDVVGRRARLYAKAPIKELLRRGWVEPTDSIDVLEQRVMSFLEMSSLDDEPQFSAAAKRTDYSEQASPSQIAWLCRARQLAREMVLPTYSERALRESLDRLRAFLTEPEEARHVPRVVAECGVRFVIVESLPGSKIDGACFWLDEERPVIAMSMRFDRIDNFWFVLRHELEHVLRKDGRTEAIVDAELEGDNAGTGTELPTSERAANRAATDFCVPTKQMDSFVARKSPFFSEVDLVGFARVLGVHPGIVAGQLRRRINKWNVFGKHLVKIRFAVLPSATVDGWGEVTASV